MVGILPLAFATPANAIILWAWSAMLSPSETLYDPLKGFPLQKIFALIGIGAFLLIPQKRRVRFDASLILMIALLIDGTISEAVSPWSWDHGWFIQDGLMKVVVLACLVSWVMTDRLRIHSLVFAMCIGMAFSGVWDGTLFFLSGGTHQVRPIAGHGDNNEFALLIDMTIPLVFYLWRQSEEKLVRIACLVVVFLFVGAVMATRSRGGFAGMALMGILVAFFSRRRILALIMVGVLGAGIIAFSPSKVTERLQTIETADQDSSFMGRVIAWKISTLIALDRPLIGGGFYAVQNWDVWVHFWPEFDRLSFIPTAQPDTTKAHAAHSVYFEVLGDLGFPGLAIFLGMVGSGFLHTRRIRKLSRGKPELKWAYDLARATELSLILLLTSGGLLSTAYYEINYLILGLISATRRHVMETVAQQGVPAPARPSRIRFGGGAVGAPAAAGVAAGMNPQRPWMRYRTDRPL